MDRNALRVVFLVLAAWTLAAAAPAFAQTVYKLIDRDGKVTYSESPPKDFDGQVIRIDIDPNANKATLGVPQPTPQAAGEGKKRAHVPEAAAPDRSKRIEEAREKLDDARKALEEARANPGPDDMRFLGKVGGGSRSVPTEAYQQRLDKLEHAVKEAENELAKAQSGD